jgi:hypothetical protein
MFMQGFSVESETSGISSSSTSWQDLEARYKSSNQVNMTQTRDQTREYDKLRGPSQKSAESCETRSFVQLGGKLTTRSHMQKGEGSRRLGNQLRAKEVTKWAKMGPGRPAQPVSRPSRPPFDLDASRAIYSPLTKSYASNQFVIRRRGAEKLEGHHLGDEGRASCLGSP